MYDENSGSSGSAQRLRRCPSRGRSTFCSLATRIRITCDRANTQLRCGVRVEPCGAVPASWLHARTAIRMPCGMQQHYNRMESLQLLIKYSRAAPAASCCAAQSASAPPLAPPPPPRPHLRRHCPGRALPAAVQARGAHPSRRIPAGLTRPRARVATQRVADFVTASNSEDGAAKALERFVLGA